MSNDEMTNGVKKAIEDFQSAVDVAYAQFASFVDSVIFGRLTNIYTIEHTMDYMVGFGFDARIEALYKKLCRFLYPKYPQMIVNHVKGYLETNREEDMAEEFIELHFKVDQDLYDEVQNVLAPLGITVEKATELFFETVARLGRISFEYSDADIQSAKECCKISEASVFEDIKTGIEQAIEYERAGNYEESNDRGADTTVSSDGRTSTKTCR